MKSQSFVRWFVALTAALTFVAWPISAADETKPAAKVPAMDPNKLSPELQDVAKLVQSGVDESIILAYVRKSPPTQPLTADELVYLKDLGLSSQALVVLLNSARHPPSFAQSTASQTAPAPAAAPVVRTAPLAPPVVYAAPAPVYVERPVVTYDPFWTYPAISFGFHLGHHIFGHHFFGHHGFGHHRGHH